MAGEIRSKTFLILMLVIEAVLGNAITSENKIAFGQRTTPCYINYHEETQPLSMDSNVTRLNVYISTPWMRHKGCYLYQQTFSEKKQDYLKHISPGRCSLFCWSSGYFGLRKSVCICFEAQDLKGIYPSRDNCDKKCPNPKTNAACGSINNLYIDVYDHNIDFQQDLKNVHEAKYQHNVNKTCMVVKKNDSKVKFKAVHCSRKHHFYCWISKKEKKYYGEKSKAEVDMYVHDIDCPLLGDDWITQKDEIPNNNTFIWTPFIRSKVCILKNYITKHKIPNHSKCLLEKGHNWSTARLLLNRTEDVYSSIHLQCILKRNLMCNVVNVTGITIPKDSGNRYVQQENTTERESTFMTLSTEAEGQRVSTNAESTFISELNTTDATFLFEKSVFPLQIGIAVGVSCMVILFATLSCCINKPKRSEENVVMAMEGPPKHTIPTAALAENYSDPKDKASTSSEMEGPGFFATASCQKTENGEYQHLDFTLRSETTPRFADNNEYDHVRANVISVFEQPWDMATSKVNKLFSQISKSVVQKGQNMRKSLIKRRASRTGSPKLKCRASDYCETWKTQLNHQQFVFDSDVDNQNNISIDEATVDSNKHESELRSTDSAFPVLPYSERINVKSTHIYDEPDDRRMSLRGRLLHMISIRPLKMPFGIELDLRASRSKSKIYSLATSIDEIDESVA